MWLTGLSFQCRMEWWRGREGWGEGWSENRKLLFNQQPDMTDDKAVPCGKRACPPETLQLRAVGQRKKSGRGQEVKFLRYKVLPTLLCSLFFLFFFLVLGLKVISGKDPPLLSVPLLPRLLKRLGETWSPGVVTDRLSGCFCSSARSSHTPQKEEAWLFDLIQMSKFTVLLSVKVGAVILFVPVSPTALAPPSPLWPLVSDPFLHGAFAVEYVAWRTLPLELHHSVDEHQQAQCQHTGDDDGDGFYRVSLVVQLDHHVRVAVVSRWASRVDGLTAHEVLEDGAWVARLHSEELVVELPVLLPLVEVGETWDGGKKQKKEIVMKWSCFYVKLCVK